MPKQKRHYDVYQRGDGRWSGCVTQPDGTRKHVYDRDKDKAQDKLDRARDSVKQGLPIPPERLTVRQYLPQWLEARKPQLSLYTRERYSQQIAHWVRLLGNRKLGALTGLDVQQAETALLETLSPSTVHVAHGVLHGALRQAVAWNLIPRNPMEFVKAPREQRTDMKTLSEEEARRLIADEAGRRYHALWVLLVTSALRLREGLGLRWQDVDLGTGRLVVQVKLPVRKADSEGLLETKSRGSRRTVMIPEGTVKALRAWHRQQAEDKLAAGPAWKDTMGLVFTTSTGAPLYGSQARQAWKATTRRLGLPDLRIHDLRHTAATLLLQKGVHIKLVSEMLGHSDVAMTLRVYAHVIPAAHAEAAQKMESLF